ncbi:MAG TPA: hypothetical protein VKS82_07475 [Streptosporangiaceae bacterium]|jgi:hypothetical protein|nr:hypothetical protein [Streptosporangiaceae bacterium]
MPSIRTWRLLLMLSGMAATAALVAGSGPASAALAAANPRTGTTAIAVRVPMSLDCTTMSTSAHRYAVAHGYCAGAAKASAPSPENRVYGDCGDSYIYITALGSGWAKVTYGFDSSQGAVVYRWLGVAVRNANTGQRSDFLDASLMFGSSYANNRNLRPGIGWVDVGLAGYVDLWWGGQCTILNPTDAAYVF